MHCNLSVNTSKHRNHFNRPRIIASSSIVQALFTGLIGCCMTPSLGVYGVTFVGVGGSVYAVEGGLG